MPSAFFVPAEDVMTEAMLKMTSGYNISSRVYPCENCGGKHWYLRADYLVECAECGSIIENVRWTCAYDVERSH
jgi:DNA-directed RNA polymerase subunit RPC12/RpoP